MARVREACAAGGPPEAQRSIAVTEDPADLSQRVEAGVALPIGTDELFEVLLDPRENRRVFTSTNVRIKKSELVADEGGGVQRLRMTQTMRISFLGLSIGLDYDVDMWRDVPQGTIVFKLAKPGLFKAFEGSWHVTRCPIGCPNTIHAQLSQRVLPKVVPPTKRLRGLVNRVSHRFVSLVMDDLQREARRLRSGAPRVYREREGHGGRKRALLAGGLALLAWRRLRRRRGRSGREE